jgi:peptidoglycan pentaglycine glycine transferase (the first glycine)
MEACGTSDISMGRKLAGAAAGPYLFDRSVVADDQWSSLLQGLELGNIWQHPVYGRARWGKDCIELCRLVAQGETRIAAMVALTKVPLLGKRIAYVQFGPVWQRRGSGPNEVVLAEFLQRLRRHYVDERGMLLWVRPREATGDVAWIASAFQKTNYRPQPFSVGRGTYRLALQNSLEDIHATLSKSWRRNLKRALGQGFEYRRYTGQGGFDIFVRLYGEMTARKQLAATPETRAFKAVCQEQPGAARLETFVCSLNGEPLAAVIVSSLGDTGLALMSATSLQARDLRAGYALDWWCVEQLRSAGMRWYDLSGDQTAGVNEYKSGLTGTAGQVRFPGPFVAGGGYISTGLFFGLRALVRKVEQYR